MTGADRVKIANRISIITIFCNAALTALKLLVGVFAHSGALIADAVHSLSDVATTVGVMVGVKIASKQEDADHPYGHEKMESITAIILSLILAITALGIGYSGITSMIDGAYKTVTPNAAALIAAGLSIIVKEIMYWYTRAGARKIESQSMLADAWHHRSDALSSVGSLIGIGLAIVGFPIFDPIAAVIICLFVLKVAFDIFMTSQKSLVDYAGDSAEIQAMRQDILKVEGVIRIDMMKTRQKNSKMYVDLEISINKDLTFQRAHEICEEVHDMLETNHQVIHCMVHANPL